MAAEDALVREAALDKALAHLRVALELLDGAEAPAQIGAHIDLARCQLEEELQASSLDKSRGPGCEGASSH